MEPAPHSLSQPAEKLEIPLSALAPPLDWPALFGRGGPNALEIGTGNGLFLAAEAARRRVELAGEVQYRVLRPALLALFQNGPERIDLRHDASARKADPFLATFDHAIDRDFFPRLWEELEADDPDTAGARRAAWVRDLLGQALAIVNEADHTAPKSAHRRYRARVRALQELALAPRRSTLLADYIEEKTHDDAA